MEMARDFSFELALLFNQTAADCAGNWQYAAANGKDQITGIEVQLIATKRTNAIEPNSFPASMLTATILFPATPGEVPPNMTLQGVHDLSTNNESGSVSAASGDLADQVGGTFTFEAGPPSILKINAPRRR
jgi:hypothetical protein